MNPTLRRECQYIVQAAREYGSRGGEYQKQVVHLDNIPGAGVYVRDSGRIQRRIPPQARVLDWGCGFGQVAWLLANRGHQVSACDWSRRPNTTAFLDERISYFPLTGPVHIDVPDASFDVVVSSGTLEHVDNILNSLQEIRRILTPTGWFVIFRFPNEYSISEQIAQRSGRWAHSVRMTKAELQFLLRMVSFRVAEIGYDSFLPIFLGYRLRALRPWRARWDRELTMVDRMLTHLPVISAFSTSIYCFAQVNAEYNDVAQV
ncbi:MAG TPA: class I SAM-dependent methyltransferase [Chloroflexia bacterium]|nr:class I SAM-dependent methyltransferase [Chloroflexia bacterium]